MLLQHIKVSDEVWRASIDMMAVEFFNNDFLLFSHHKNFEVYVYNLKTKKIVRTFLGHKEQTRGFLVVDRQTFLTCSFDCSLRMHDVWNGETKLIIKDLLYCNSRTLLKLTCDTMLYSRVRNRVYELAICEIRTGKDISHVSHDRPQGFWFVLFKDRSLVSYNRRVVYVHKINDTLDEIKFEHDFSVRSQTRTGVEIEIRGKSYLAIAMSDVGIDIYDIQNGRLVMNINDPREQQVHYLHNFQFGILGSVGDSGYRKFFRLYGREKSPTSISEPIYQEKIIEYEYPREKLVINHICQRRRDFQYVTAINNPPGIMMFDSPILPNGMTEQTMNEDRQDFDEKFEFLNTRLEHNNMETLSITNYLDHEVMKIPKILLFSSDLKDELYISKKFQFTDTTNFTFDLIDEEVIIRIMFGNGNHLDRVREYFERKDGEAYLSYFRFFSTLGCFWYASVILRLLDDLDTNLLARLFKISVTNHQINKENKEVEGENDDQQNEEEKEGEDDDERFDKLLKKSELTLSPFEQEIVNILNRRQNMKPKEKIVIRGLNNIMNLKMKRLDEHYDERYRHEFYTFFDAYRHVLSLNPLKIVNSCSSSSSSSSHEICSTPKPPLFSNLVLEVQNQRFNVNSELLISSSNFFFRMIRFQGVESVEMENRGIISIDVMTVEELIHFLNYIYSKNLDLDLHGFEQNKEQEIEGLVKLLCIAEKYIEYDMIRDVLIKIQKLCLEIYHHRRYETTENSQELHHVSNECFERIQKEADKLPMERRKQLLLFFKIFENSMK